MNHRVGLGAFGTFGEPFGYQQVFFLNAVFGSSLDLNANAIEVCPGAELYAVKREAANGTTAACCCLYTYAKEPASNRGGTFVGCCVVLNNSRLKGEAIYKLLRELHTDLVGNPKNLVDNTLQVQKAEQLVVTEPASFAAIAATATAISTTINKVPVDERKKFLIQPPTAPFSDKHIANFFEDAVTYFTDTDTMYFTDDERITQYVAEKGLIPLADWQAFQNYKVRQQEEKAAARKAEMAKKGEKPPPAKNAAPPVKIPALYDEWTEVKPDKESFRRMTANHNALLKEYLELKQLRQSLPLSNGTTSRQANSTRSSFRIKKKYLLFTIIVLLALLLTTSGLLLFRTPAAVQETAVALPSSLVEESSVPEKQTGPVDSLSPMPNTELVKSDVGKLAKEKIKGKGLRQVVDAIFLKNPAGVAESYSWQKKEYAELLVQKNAACFRKDSGDYTCTCDTLLHIPAFKK
jgi:hypothetical protein